MEHGEAYHEEDERAGSRDIFRRKVIFADCSFPASQHLFCSRENNFSLTYFFFTTEEYFSVGARGNDARAGTHACMIYFTYIRSAKNEKKVTTSMDKQPKVVIIDDSATVRQALRRCLQQAGYDVRVAADGHSGWKLLLNDLPQCLLLDIVLPGVNGFQLCRTLRTVVPRQHLPVILMSTKSTPLDQQWGLRQGADRYLVKPFTQDMLLHMVQEVLSIRAGKRQENIIALSHRTLPSKEVLPLCGSVGSTATAEYLSVWP
jgi:CheY-like chemotaxis protein